MILKSESKSDELGELMRLGKTGFRMTRYIQAKDPVNFWMRNRTGSGKTWDKEARPPVNISV